MSEQLTIEILREKFKEAQEKGDELIIQVESYPQYVSDKFLNIKYIGQSTIVGMVGDEECTYGNHDNMQLWKIKQPKDEYETLYEYMDEDYRLFLNKYDGLLNAVKTKRKLLRNTRTGEILKYNEDLLK